MVCDDNPGVLDFQDACIGACTYDLVSLLKDCYIAWPRERVLGWLREYRAMAASLGMRFAGDEGEFVRAFDLTGLQRHLKVLGIFCRLWYRDGKRGYLSDLPLVLDYALEATAAEPGLAGLDRLLRERVVPAFAAAQAREGAGT
jgi:aminoglycoside/choline kinase family phosphotransferase